MARKYESKVRAETKARTIGKILDAALRLHGQGIADMEPVAAEAGVSLATVRKYFPTREDLFQGCTAHFLFRNPPPDLGELWAIADGAERLSRTVRLVCAVQESVSGQIWLAHQLMDESPAMAAAVAGMEEFVRAAARIILGDQPVHEELLGFVYAMLSPLTYRAFRQTGGLDPDATARRLETTLALALGVQLYQS